MMTPKNVFPQWQAEPVMIDKAGLDSRQCKNRLPVLAVPGLTMMAPVILPRLGRWCRCGSL